MPISEEISYIEAASLATPDTNANWFLGGLGPNTITVELDGWHFAATSNQSWTYFRKAVVADRGFGAARPEDTIEIAATIRIDNPGGFDNSRMGLYISDGARSIFVGYYIDVSGNALAWYDHEGTLLRKINQTWPWPISQRYLLRKEGCEAFELVVDGVVVDRYPYDAAPAAPGLPDLTTGTGWDADANGNAAIVAFGALLVAGAPAVIFAKTFIVDEVEHGTNLRVAPMHKVERLLRSFPPAYRSRISPFWRKVARATVGLFEGAEQAIERVRGLHTAKKLVDHPVAGNNDWTLKGDRLPTSEVPALSESATTAFTLVRERVRMATTNGFPEIAYADWHGGAIAGAHESRAHATFTLISTSPPAADANGYQRIGPSVLVADGVKAANAVFWTRPGDTADGGAIYVSLVGSLPGAAVLVVAGEAFPINPYRATKIAVHLFTPDWAIVLVDEQIVAKVAYEDLPDSVLTRGAIGGDGRSTSVFDVELGRITRSWADMSHRAMFLQDAIERLYALGGCERNDELEVWAKAAPAQHEARGTTNEVLVELQRMACSTTTVAVRETEVPGSWYLDLSWPDVTPIWLDFNGLLRVITAEFPEIGNLTPQETADFLVRYILPVSVPELQYRAALSYAALARVESGATRLTIASTRYFEVGDVVDVIDNVTGDVFATTVQTIVSDTVLDVDTVAFTDQGVMSTADVLAKYGAATIFVRADDVDVAGADVTNWPDQSGNAHDMDVINGTAPLYTASYVGFGGMPAIAFAAVGNVETTDTVQFTDFTTLVGYKEIAPAGDEEVLVDHTYTLGWWIGRGVATPTTWRAGIRAVPPPYGMAIEVADAPAHIIGMVREGAVQRTAVDGASPLEAACDDTITASNPVSVGGGPSSGVDFSGYVAFMVAFDHALTEAQIADFYLDMGPDIGLDSIGRVTLRKILAES